jgi:G3E family GTPase
MPALRPYVKVDSIITVVDAEQIRDLRGEQNMLAVDQVSAADIVVLNKVDLVTPKELAEVKAWIYEVTPRARIMETMQANVPLELLLGVGEFAIERLAARAPRDVHTHEAGDDAHNHDHAHDHSLVFNTWSYATDEPIVYEALCDVVDGLPGTIFRAKGLVFLKEAPERRGIMHVVGRRATLTLGEKWGAQKPRTQLVVIGSHGGVDAEMLQSMFDSCRAGAVARSGQDPLQNALNWVRRNWPKQFGNEK